MPDELEQDPTAAVRLCRAAHRRLLQTAEGLQEAQAAAPSQLPGWSIGHVLTHLARNAEGMARRLEGALAGREVPRYPGGRAQRDADIEAGAGRSARQLAADLRACQERLEAVWDRSEAAGWPHRELLAGDPWPTSDSPLRRMAEVEVHHADLGVGYGPADWPAPYVAWQLARLLETVPRRLHSTEDARELVAWLAGRRPLPPGFGLEPW